MHNFSSLQYNAYFFVIDLKMLFIMFFYYSIMITKKATHLTDA